MGKVQYNLETLQEALCEYALTNVILRGGEGSSKKVFMSDKLQTKILCNKFVSFKISCKPSGAISRFTYCVFQQMTMTHLKTMSAMI